MNRFGFILTLSLLLVPAGLFAEEPAGGSPPQAGEGEQAEQAPVKPDAPVFYEKYLPGYKSKPVEESIDEPSEIETDPAENRENGDENVVDPAIEINTSFWKDRNIVNLLIFIGIAAVFIIYRVRSGGRKRGL